MNLALFDFDGTISTRETFGDFIHFAVPRRRLRLGKLLLAPMVMGYKLGLVSSQLMRASAIRIGFAGMPIRGAAMLGEQFAQQILPSLLRSDVMARIAEHKAAGDRVVVVSGGLELFLRPWCKEYEIEVLGSRLEARNGRLTGWYDGPQCVAAEKPVRVRSLLRLDDYERVFAYGDTSEDFDLLRIAHHPIFRGSHWVDRERSPESEEVAG